MTEADAIQRLIDAARIVIELGATSHDEFIVRKKYADDLRAALAQYDQARGIETEHETTDG